MSTQFFSRSKVSSTTLLKIFTILGLAFLMLFTSPLIHLAAAGNASALASFPSNTDLAGNVENLLSPPALAYETIFDGATFDSGHDVAVDTAGNAFVLARAYTNNNDVMILKISPTGDVLFTSYLSGSAHEFGTGIAVDESGDVYITGWTDSTDFPIVNAYQSTLNGFRDAFITKLSGNDGSILFSTFLGGERSDQSGDIILNEAGDIYITGQTDSTQFPTTANAIQGSLNLTSCFCDDGFVTRFSPDASTLLYSTYLGGTLDDQATAIGVDAANNIYFAGRTHSPDFPTQNPAQANNNGGDWDGFVSKISADGNQLVYSTYLGGSNVEYTNRIAVDSAGFAHVAGRTQSLDFPTTSGAFQETFTGGILDCGTPGFDLRNCDDIFVTKYAPEGSYAYSTFIGGSLDDVANGIALDANGQVHVGGYSNSSDYPLDNGDTAAFIIVSQLSADGSALNYSVAVDSPVANAGHGLAIDTAGAVYLAGAQNVPSDTYVAKLASEAPPPSQTVHAADLDGIHSWRLDNRGWAATVTITVHDENHAPVSDATIYGLWSYLGRDREKGVCTTDTNGTCTITIERIRAKADNATFSVLGLDHPTLTYTPAENHDPDGDSDGTTIVILRTEIVK